MKVKRKQYKDTTTEKQVTDVSEFQNNEYIVFLEDNWAVNLVVGNYDMIKSLPDGPND